MHGRTSKYILLNGLNRSDRKANGVEEREKKVEVPTDEPSQKIVYLTTARTAICQLVIRGSGRRDLPVMSAGAACTAISRGVTGVDKGLICQLRQRKNVVRDSRWSCWTCC